MCVRAGVRTYVRTYVVVAANAAGRERRLLELELLAQRGEYTDCKVAVQLRSVGLCLDTYVRMLLQPMCLGCV